MKFGVVANWTEKMGCDGGSIPKRVEMVKLKKKDEKVRTRRALVRLWPSWGPG